MKISGAEGVPAPDDVSPLVYVDHRTLTRDCIASQLAMQMSEFSVATFSAPIEVESVEGLHSQASCVVYHTHSRRIEDVHIVRNLSLLQMILRGAPIIVLSNLEETDNIVDAMARGARGYIPTSLSLKVAAEAIRLVHAGGTFIPASTLQIAASAAAPPGHALADAAGLTPRQIEVLSHLSEGKQNKAIAHDLGMSEGTVKVHLKHIMKKLHANNRTQVVLIMRRFLGEREAAAAGPGRQAISGVVKDIDPEPDPSKH